MGSSSTPRGGLRSCVSVIGAVTTLGGVALPIAFGLLVLGEDASAERLAGMAAIGLGALLLGRRTGARAS